MGNTLEDIMCLRGIDRFRNKAGKAMLKGIETILPGQSALVKRSIALMTAHTQAFIQEALSGNGVRDATVAAHLQDMKPDIIAVIVGKFLMNIFHKERSLSRTSIDLSQALDMERDLVVLAKEHGQYYDYMTRELSKVIANPNIVQAIAIRKAREKGVLLSEKRPTAEHIRIGSKLIELFAEATGFIEIQLEKQGTKVVYVIRPRKEALDFIKSVHARMETLSPMFGPLLNPPEPWTDTRTGGFETIPTLLVRNRNRKTLDTLYENHSMPLVYEAINAIQNTGYRVNRRVYEVFVTLWEKRLEIAGLPERYNKNNHERPSKKDPKGTLKRRDHAELLTKNIACLLTMASAKEYLEADTFYFVHSIDFRGRAYPVTGQLSPQGNDWSKGLLTFAEGKPLGDHGAKWLAIHGANCFGLSKVPFEERHNWVNTNADKICRAAQSPLDDYWWTEADKPFQFLAFCFEWEGFVREGNSYVSSLPVGVDGSCNALQHFAALLRDRDLGLRVNMVPSDNPKDIYQEITDKLIVKAKEETAKTRGKSPAKHWIHQLNRAVVKTPVMTYYYGASHYGMGEQVRDAIKEEGLKFNYKKDMTHDCVQWLVTAIRESIPVEMPTVHIAMEFLKSVTNECCKRGKPVVWTTPSGFKVALDNINTKGLGVRTRLFGVVRELQYKVAQEPLSYDKRMQANGIAPHLIHSLDASAMVLCVNEALPHGIKDFRMIHDGFATLPADMEQFIQCIRKGFIDVYKGKNILMNLVWENLGRHDALVGKVPLWGTLKLPLIQESEYFFA